MGVNTKQMQAAVAHVVVAGREMPDFRHIGVEPITGACGAEIMGVDLQKPLSSEVLCEVMTAFEHFLVIMFRDQNLTIEQHKAFSRYFGELTELPQAPIYAGDREMQEVRREAHEPVSVVPFTRFHTDSPFLAQPPLCMVMRAIDAPRFGGDTAFANMYLAYEELSAGLKTMLGQLRVVYRGKIFGRKTLSWIRRNSCDCANPTTSPGNNLKTLTQLCVATPVRDEKRCT